mmetsp:Transcript_7315/g.18284  ORF Transcript_7315/g.18284 Transcript_7315/m.18284 type:complete len:259 (-) Transcript_7315:139-915(-)
MWVPSGPRSRIAAYPRRRFRLPVPSHRMGPSLLPAPSPGLKRSDRLVVECSQKRLRHRQLAPVVAQSSLRQPLDIGQQRKQATVRRPSQVSHVNHRTPHSSRPEAARQRGKAMLRLALLPQGPRPGLVLAPFPAPGGRLLDSRSRGGPGCKKSGRWALRRHPNRGWTSTRRRRLLGTHTRNAAAMAARLRQGKEASQAGRRHRGRVDQERAQSLCCRRASLGPATPRPAEWSRPWCGTCRVPRPRPWRSAGRPTRSRV